MQKSDNTLPLRPSKSQRKREVLALQKIGETLVKLPVSQLEKIPLENFLAEAIHHARSLKSHEAIRRQLQYIGKLMREVDIKPIEDALAKIQNKDNVEKAKFHQIERWRDRLIQEDDASLEEFIQAYSDVDRQRLRQLVRHAKQQKKPGVETELFRFLRDIIVSAGAD